MTGEEVGQKVAMEPRHPGHVFATQLFMDVSDTARHREHETQAPRKNFLHNNPSWAHWHENKHYTPSTHC